MRRSCNTSSVVAPHMALNRESGDMNMILIVVANPGIAILRPCVRFRHLRCWGACGAMALLAIAPDPFLM